MMKQNQRKLTNIFLNSVAPHYTYVFSMQWQSILCPFYVKPCEMSKLCVLCMTTHKFPFLKHIRWMEIMTITLLIKTDTNLQRLQP